MNHDPSRPHGWQAPLSRRRFVQGLALGGLALGTAGVRLPAHAATDARSGPQVLRGNAFDLSIGSTPVNFTGRTRPAITVNGSLPAPLLRWRQGETVTLRVANRLPDAVTSIHWHGIILPANMDGVPGLSFDGVAPGEAYLYRFTLGQSGSYWYHSHSLFQEQAGLYGAIIIDPAEPLPYHWDREHVVLLSDWTDLDPGRLFQRLKKESEYDNRYKPTVGDFVRDVREHGWSQTVADRRAWARMRMTPTDISDVNAHTYTYLMNGTTPASNWTGLFRSGEKVLLRFINAGAMTYFDVRIPGLKMTVVAADGLPVHPVTVDEFRIAAAETFDVIVEPSGQDAYTIFAQDMGRTGFARGTLAVRPGLEAPLPAIDPRPRLTMADMGHGDHAMHGASSATASTPSAQGVHADGHAVDAHAGAHAAQDMLAGHGAPETPGMHAGHGTGAMQAHPASESRNPLVDMQTMTPTPRLDDPGIGLRDNGRRVLAYADLASIAGDQDGRDPGREVELHLTGHMGRFSWSFDGIPFASAQPLRLNYGERVRIVLVNDTMMTHPIHLHGVWSDLEDANGDFMVRKHTVDMPPGTRRSYRVRADAAGRWAFHCHLLYHMEAGMMREVHIGEAA
ncbi:copper resistance system multicopper oxidase [Luteimonas yindakuii]|uniref:Copper resistance system multicopper oxidase n=1 Tax=Luteimonas yindakuii TaxID=2565782 RepID=A0A4Z1RMV5_9GAMM|nr:copper resistance system multicopper oxidase [Luteimonas yindakuii]TKS54991.1 copper resistance system multicopper oxidase [Luteimonas yindakuii]